VLAEAVLSQQEHAAFGGVVPEIAARAHLLHLPALVGGVMAKPARLFPTWAAWPRPVGRG